MIACVQKIRGIHVMLVAISSGLLCGASGGESVAILCPALDAEHVAALSARLRADLAVRDADGGLTVVCEQGKVWTTWVPAKGAAVAQQTPLSAGEGVSEERVLEATDRLFSTLSAPAAAEPSETVRSEEPARASTLPDTTSAAKTPDETQSKRIGAQLGTEGERWSQTLTGDASVHANVLAHLLPRLDVTAGGGLGWALAPPGGLTARTFDVRAHADAYVWKRFVSVGAGALATHLSARSADGLEDADWSFALELRARVAQAAGPLRALVGPFARIRPGPTVVTRGGVEQFRIPILTAGLALDVEVDLFGGR